MKKRFFSKSALAENLPFILSFLIPVLIMIAIFFIQGIYPFGDNSFLRTDMYHQYAPFFSELLRKLRAGEGLTWSWNVGLGSNFTALFAYYLASPLNWLVFLFPQRLLIEFMTYLIVIKIGLCGLAFSWYLSRHFRTKRGGIAFFGILYALSAYLAAYSWNIMWLDCIILAPLIMLGLERLVQENKCFLYCITLGLSILSNYYIAIMICIFMVLYFIALMLMLPADHRVSFRKKNGTVRTLKPYQGVLYKCFHFGLYSLLAGGFAAVLLLPEISALGMTASAKADFPKTFTTYFPVIDMLARHFVNVPTEIGLDHWPNIYCGVLVLLLTPLYVMNKNINYREKIVKLALLFFLLLSFSTNVLNFIWHGFHYPNSLPCRQSFLYIALLLTLCYEAYHHLKDFTPSHIVSSFWGGLVFILLCQKLVTGEDFTLSIFVVTAIFLGLYSLIIYLMVRGKTDRTVAAILILSLIAIESSMNTSFTSVTITSRSAYVKSTEDYQTLVEEVKKNDPGFYRIEKFSRKTKNDGTWAGYPTASVFSSTANANVSTLYKELGLESSTNAYCYQGATPVTSAMLGVRYLFSDNASLSGDLYTLTAQSGDVCMYRNNYTLPIGYVIPADTENKWDYTYGHPILAQNSFASVTAGTSQIFKEVYGTSSGPGFQIETTEDAYLYIYISNASVDEVTAVIGDRTETFKNVKRGYLLDMGYCKAGTYLSLNGENNEQLNAAAYKLDINELSKFISELSRESLVIEDYNDTSLSGYIDLASEGLLVTSIPYEKGWTLYVDGQKTDIRTFADTMISVVLPAGHHTIELKYYPDGLTAGMILSAVSILLFAGIVMFSRRQKKSLSCVQIAEKAVDSSEEIVENKEDSQALTKTEGNEEE